MVFETLQLASRAFALLICLCIIILPPLLAVASSAIRTVIQIFGEPLLNLLNYIALGVAYLAQVGMMCAALGCIYYGSGGYTIDLDDAIPDSIAPIFRFTVSFALALAS